jgi:hypothetical protein
MLLTGLHFLRRFSYVYVLGILWLVSPFYTGPIKSEGFRTCFSKRLVKTDSKLVLDLCYLGVTFFLFIRLARSLIFHFV